MTQEVKKAPGRPKAQTKAVEEAVMESPVKFAPVAKKKRNIKRSETILHHAEYEIPKNAGDSIYATSKRHHCIRRGERYCT